jgi:hypothetical protein
MKSSYGGAMNRVLFVCKEYGWVHNVSQVFPELDLFTTRLESLTDAFIAQQENPSDALVLDVGLFEADRSPLEQVQRLAHTSQIILLAPSDFQEEALTAALGVQVLRKPITVGEVGLALKRASRIR